MEKKERMNISKKRFVTILTGSILATAFLVSLVIAATPTTTFSISGGLYPGATQFTIWQETTNYFAKNQYGQIEFSGSNSSLVIQNALNDLTLGGIVLLEAGDYDLGTTTLTMPVINYGLQLIGCSAGTLTYGTTRLTYSGTGTAIQVGLNSTQHSGYKITDLTIYMNGTKSAQIGIESLGAIDDLYQNLQIRNFSTGIKIDGGYDASLRPSMFGAFVECKHIYMVGCTVGVEVTGRANGARMYNLHSWGSAGPIANSKLIYSHGSQCDALSGIALYGGSLETGLDINTTNAHFNNLWLEDCTTDIILGSATRGCVIDGLVTAGHTTIITDSGARNWIRGIHDNDNGKCSERTGTASITGAVNSVDVTHLLTGTPTRVLVTGLTSGIGDIYVSNKGATTFRINFANQPGGSTWYFDWYATVHDSP